MTKVITIDVHSSTHRHTSSSPTIFVTCRDVIAKELAAKKSPKEVLDRATKELPELKTLRDILPKTRTEAYAFLTILIVVLNVVIDNYHKFKSSDTKQIIINQTIQNYNFLTNPSSSAAQPETRTKKKLRQSKKHSKLATKKTNKKAK